MVSRIEEIITEMQEYIDGCSTALFSSTKITADKDDLEGFVRELRNRLPEEIKKYRRLIANQDAVMEDAKAKAAAIINDAQIQRDELINEHEIMQNAYKQANDIVEEAARQAQNLLEQANLDAITMRESAISYTDDLLKNVQNILERAYDTNKNNYENLLDSIKMNLDTVVTNRHELTDASADNGAVSDEDDYSEEPLSKGVGPAVGGADDDM